MKLTHFLLFFFVILLGLSLLIPARFYRIQTEPRALPPDPDYRNPSLPIEARIDDLLSYMTLKEKIGQMALVEKYSVRENDDIRTFGIGAILSGAGANPEPNTPEAWKDMVDGYIDASRESRLGIPLIYGADAVHGHSNVPGATVFPHALGLGATADPALVKEVAEITADEMRATSVNWSYSPNLDLPQDIRWGRVYETFGDDPALAAVLGAAFVEGTQGTDERIHVIGTAKHYVGAGGMVWGSSSGKDYTIDQGTTLQDEKRLREEYLIPFKAAVDAGVLSVMAGLNSWGDTKLAASSFLLTDVLKGELGFKGFVVSDWFGVYEIPGDDYMSIVRAVNAGVDMVMLPFDYETFIQTTEAAVEQGDIPEARINDAVRRILRAKFALGLFDTVPDAPSLSVLGSPDHRAVAKRAVAESLVLLKNEASVLPIKPDVRHIRVAGSAADNIGRQAGAWTVEWMGIDGNGLPGATSILSGIRAYAGNDVRIDYDKLGVFDEEEKADLGIAVVGESPYAEGWGDTAIPTLSEEDKEAIRNLQKTSKHVVVILISGRPIFVTNEIDGWDAVVAAWLPGSEGDGVAEVLFGRSPFQGRLPIPWPRTTEQLPIRADGTTADGTLPLFPRYFSY